jgi:pimeloyl-ACP methyl ester carboxylesterase
VSPPPPSGLPPVVLVHGAGSSHEHAWVAPGWTDVLAEDGRTVVPFELPGHGAAPPLADLADDVDLLLAALDASGGVPVDAVGHSAGALLLLRAAARRPPAFRRLALIGVGDGVLGPPSDTGERLAEALEGPAEPADPQARVFWRLAASAGNRRADVAAYLRHRVSRLRAAELAGITAAVLLVLGDRDFAAPGDGLAAALPDARLVPLRGADHFGAASDVRAMDAVTAFLAAGG